MNQVLSLIFLLFFANSFAQQIIVKENKDTLVLTTIKKTVSYSYDTIVQTLKVYKPPTTNLPPTARSGADQTITIPSSGTTISTTLNGNTSTDPEGQVLKFFWRKVSGPPCTLIDTNKSICIVSGMTVGTYDFELRVVDPLNSFTADRIIVIVNKETTTGTPISFSFTPLTIGDPDINRPSAGAEQWHDRNDVNIGYIPQDVYYRFPATRIATSVSGVYDWNYFNGLVNSAIQKRQKVSFGIMTVFPGGSIGEGLVSFDGGLACYPQWLHNLMQGEQVKDWETGGTWTPNYNSNHYLDWLFELHQAINNHILTTSFNGVVYKDVINIIDIRGYGAWGEWHSGYTPSNQVSDYPSGTFPTVATLKKIVDAHINGFPNTKLVCMIAAFDANYLGNTMNPPEIAYYILTHPGNGAGPIGWRRDQWGATDNYLSAYLENNTRSFNGLVFRDSIMVRYKSAPITGEPPAWVPNDYADLERQIRLYHATSFGNGNYGTQTPNTTIQARVKASSKASGYRIASTGGSFTVNPSSISITNTWTNTGLCPTYENWNITYDLVNQVSGAILSVGVSALQLKTIQSGATASRTDTFNVSVPNGNYILRMAVKDPNSYRSSMPLQIQGRNSDGSYNIKTFQR